MKPFFQTIFCCLLIISCDPPNKTFDPEYVKLSMTLNTMSETIYLGDTLKFRLLIPDTLIGTSTIIPVNSLQKGFYTFKLLKIDTVNNIATRVTGNSLFVSEGTTDGFQVNVTSNAKPFASTLNIKPPSKGLYYIQITPQPGTIKVNNSYDHGLVVNFAVPDKHWYLYEPYNPGFTAAVSPLDAAGYGIYVFKVN